MKKLLSVVLALALCVSMGAMVFAANSPVSQPEIKEATVDGRTVSVLTVANSSSVPSTGDYLVLSPTSTSTSVFTEKAATTSALNNYELKNTFEISLYSDGVKVSSDGTVQVTAAIPGVAAGDRAYVLHIKDNGSSETVGPISVAAGGLITFTLNGLSPIGVFVEKSSTSGDGSTSPKTGDNTAIFAGSLAVVCIATAVLAKKRLSATK